MKLLLITINMNEKEIEGKIINSPFWHHSNYNEIKLTVGNKNYFLKFEKGNPAICPYLNTGDLLKLKGYLNEEKKIIENPHDIWVKIK